MNNSITIDKGERTTAEGKIVIKWQFTLIEEGDYETGTIKYIQPILILINRSQFLVKKKRKMDNY